MADHADHMFCAVVETFLRSRSSGVSHPMVGVALLRSAPVQRVTVLRSCEQSLTAHPGGSVCACTGMRGHAEKRERQPAFLFSAHPRSAASRAGMAGWAGRWGADLARRRSKGPHPPQHADVNGVSSPPQSRPKKRLATTNASQAKAARRQKSQPRTARQPGRSCEADRYAGFLCIQVALNVTVIHLGRGSPTRLGAYPPALRNHINAGLFGIAAQRLPVSPGLNRLVSVALILT